MSLLEKVLRYTESHKLSDLHLHADRPVSIRVDGDIQTFEQDLVSATELEAFIKETLSQEQRLEFLEKLDADLAIDTASIRFRTNLFKTSNGLAAVLRKIESKIPSFDLLGLPAAARDVIERENDWCW